MKAFLKPAIVLGLAGAMALGTMTASQARGFHHRGAAIGAAAGFAVGAAVGAAASNSYYGPGYGYYGDPGYAYTGDPGYGAYAYAPGYAPYGYGYDSAYGYNSNTTSYQRERVLEGRDY
jgi:hypothetical protein